MASSCIVLYCKVELEKKKDRLKNFVNKLLSNVPSRQRVDLSYLLQGPTGKRQTRKPAYLQQFLDTSKHYHDTDPARLWDGLDFCDMTLRFLWHDTVTWPWHDSETWPWLLWHDSKKWSWLLWHDTWDLTVTSVTWLWEMVLTSTTWHLSRETY